MKKSRQILSVLLALVLLAASVGCGGVTEEEKGQPSGTVTETTDTDSATETENTATETSQSPSDTDEENVTAEIVEYTPKADRLENISLSNPELDRYSYTADSEEGDFDSDFSCTLELEDGSLSGAARLEENSQASGGSLVDIAGNAETDLVTVTFTVPASGLYCITAGCSFPYGEKANNVLIDGANVGELHGLEQTSDIIELSLSGIYIAGGEHTLTLSPGWGWWQADYIRITAENGTSATKTKEKSSELCDIYATLEAKMLYQFLQDIDGKYTLSGQVGDNGMASNEFISVYEATGRYPAILGLDLMSYSPVRAAHGEKCVTVQKAIDYYTNQGGIVTLCWHWTLDSKYDKEGAEYWRGMYSDYIDLEKLDLTAIVNGENPEGLEDLYTDIDSIAFYLKQLQEANVPVLFRPLHEASGGWFWWGAYGADTYLKLWKLLYTRLVDYHGLHNLIWVWNGQAADWYPGDEYCDIVSTDIYPGEKVYSSQAAKYWELNECSDSYKPIVLSENGCLFDPDLAIRDNALWTWFCTWGGEITTVNGTINEQYTECSMWDKVYNHTAVITLDELPDLTNYGK